MFQLSQWEMTRFQHSHGDDDWHDMSEVPAHDAAESDPERSWQNGRIFRCNSCAEEIRVQLPETEQANAVNPGPRP